MKLPFICFDGIDGSGKDTQARLLFAAIQDGKTKFPKTTSVWMTKEQTDLTSEGRLISTKLEEKNFDVGEATELFIKDRLKHSLYINEIQKHSIVISVRYFLSTLAYQSAQGESMETIWDMHIKPAEYFPEMTSFQVLIPDYYFYISINEQEAINRIKQNRSSEFQVFEKIDFLNKVLTQYNYAIKFLKSKGINIIQINGLDSKDKILEEILNKI
jgi:dTMP kinase